MIVVQREHLSAASKMLAEFASGLLPEMLERENEMEAWYVELEFKPRTPLQIKNTALQRADEAARLAFDVAVNGRPRERNPDRILVGADIVINSPDELAGEIELHTCLIRVNCEKPFSKLRRGSVIDGCTISYKTMNDPLVSLERAIKEGGRVSDPPILVTNNVFQTEGEK